MVKSDKRLLCEDYCRQYPPTKMKTLTLAKKIYEENKTLFKSAEIVRRNYLLKIKGLAGEQSRQSTKDKSLFQERTYDTSNSKPQEIDTSAKILILDIETAPIRAYVWGIWQQNVGITQIDSDWFCLTWAAKWLFDKKVYSGSLTPQEAIGQNDKRIIHGLWALMNEADVVVAHNGDKFDIPKINTRFLLHGFNPPLPYQSIDTLKHIKRQFSFTSNKLDYVNKLLRLERKQETGGFELWEGCYKGELKCLRKMLRYNIQDVKILEETYLRIRSWIKPHPSVGLHILDENQSRCPTCGSPDLIDEKKGYHTQSSIYELYRCGNCGSVSRKRLNSVTVKEKRHLVISSAR